MSAAPTFRLASCSACRLSALRLFAGSHAAASRASQNAFRGSLVLATAARYSTFRGTRPLLKGLAIEERNEPETQTIEDALRDANTDSNGSDVPWYLQVEPPRHPALLHEPPPLPEVPEGSPKMMEPLLKFVSDELGLDELKLLDLRELDPPPALGPELLMLIGTARSERHLHVSADRLVRWLRGRGCSAKADGLLGRNELKIRLRRKARKAKLLGNSGVARSSDDGISTGWICVNLGTVGWSDQEMQTVDESGRPTGFGVPQTGTTIVVQMMTEARREELDLERLWSGQLRRSIERNAGLPFTKASDGRDYTSSNADSFSTQRGLSMPSDRRYFSTSTVRRSTAPAAVATPTRPEGVPAIQSILAGKQRGLISGSELEALESALPDILANDEQSKIYLLTQMQHFLESLPADQAREMLTSFQPGKPAPFHKLFNRTIQNLSPAQVWSAQTWLYFTGRKLKLPGHDFDSLQTFVKDQLLADEVDLQREQFLSLLRVIYAALGTTHDELRMQSTLAMDVVDAMFARGYKVLDHELLVTVIESTVKNPDAEAKRLLSMFEYLLAQADLPCPSENHLLRLLEVYASVGNWDRFWAVWRIPPRYVQPRSRAMYRFLFDTFAKSGDQARCMEAVRWTVQEMVNEQPPVLPEGSLLEALKACIRVADPGAEQIAETVSPDDKTAAKLVNREFVKLLRNLGVTPRGG